ncbi:unnamed protein product [Clonostachys rosea]|uniref:Uncharacterized protein n=1 Tax=Bionectria ochroleuca TaxID=29856 RepID=A0ABY6TZL9_BIOOC|nr:unnamed protein product [Clonostachys rosea]
MSGSGDSKYPVWRAYFTGTPRDHVGIFIQTQPNMVGTLIQVRGAIERPRGMSHDKLENFNLHASQSFIKKKQLGYTTKEKAGEFWPCAVSEPAPTYQFANGPPAQAIRCNEWQAEYEKKLYEEGLLVDIQKTDDVEPLAGKYPVWYGTK